ncbi:gem-associated protein 4 [Hypomesus transpacificus]|uniref:gem-associated protein 4 n=1 Tax=Hypomesus transpacificus TaxID=137520 RepID=UPI001F0753B0|nr:gem-associated protein 4 [Hypomesus transpacificus]
MILAGDRKKEIMDRNSTMDQESWLSCEKTAQLQGGFLLANKLCEPASLGSLEKQHWGKVGQPILQAVSEVCRQEQRGGRQQESLHWKKRLLCVVWSKLLASESGEDVERGWRENPLFPVQSSLPEVNSVVLLELTKALKAAPLYAGLLLGLAPERQSLELERLVQHLTCCPTPEDGWLLLQVWRELWRAGGEGAEDDLSRVFAEQCARLPNPPSDLPSQAAKRFKLDPEKATPPPQSSSATSVLSILLQAMEDLRHYFLTPDLCFSGLSILLDSLSTCYLRDSAPLPAPIWLQHLTRAVALREMQDGSESCELVQLVREAQTDMHAAFSPSRFKECGLGLGRLLGAVSELLLTWDSLLKTDSSIPSPSALSLQASLMRTLESLSQSDTRTQADTQAMKDFQKQLTEVLENLSLPKPESTLAEQARVALVVLEHRLEGNEELAAMLAAELSWSPGEEEWISCLERNKMAFLQTALVMKLVSTLVATCQSSSDAGHSRRLKNLILDIFSQLPQADKNTALAEILICSSRGLHGVLPLTLSQDFPQELNMAFNCLTQGGVASEKDNVSAAVVAVARVAFQNPEATLERCCRMALCHRGGHTLLANILCQLPGLKGGARDGGRGLLLCCLEKAVGSRLASAQEEDQLLHFLLALMTPCVTQGLENGQSFLSPQEVVCAFVLPHLSSSSCGPVSLELGLRLLLSTLSLPLQDASPHWLLGCSPFPLLLILSQQLNLATRCWEEPAGISMEAKELLVSVLVVLGPVLGREVASVPATWSRALSWLYNKVQNLDWTVRLYLKPVWGEHFKMEVPSSLLAVCELGERDWAGLDLAQYSQGTGLLAWLECCALSDSLQDTMLACLDLDQKQPHHVSMFSKGMLVGLVQMLPWSTAGEWRRLLRVLRELLVSGRLHVPYSLEYVDFLPLMDLRPFSCQLRLSVLLLRALQLLCGSSCSDWLPARGWAHVGRLYASAMRELVEELRVLQPTSTHTSTPKVAAPSNSSPATSPKNLPPSPVQPPSPCPAQSQPGDRPQEVLFVLTQLFCHVQHIQVMMSEAAEGPSEPLFLVALEILSQYEAVLAAFPTSSSPLERDNTLLFLSTITDNLQEKEMKSVLHQKISQVLSS